MNPVSPSVFDSVPAKNARLQSLSRPQVSTYLQELSNYVEKGCIDDPTLTKRNTGIYMDMVKLLGLLGKSYFLTMQN